MVISRAVEWLEGPGHERQQPPEPQREGEPQDGENQRRQRHQLNGKDDRRDDSNSHSAAQQHLLELLFVHLCNLGRQPALDSGSNKIVRGGRKAQPLEVQRASAASA